MDTLRCPHCQGPLVVENYCSRFPARKVYTLEQYEERQAKLERIKEIQAEINKDVDEFVRKKLLRFYLIVTSATCLVLFFTPPFLAIRFESIERFMEIGAVAMFVLWFVLFWNYFRIERKEEIRARNVCFATHDRTRSLDDELERLWESLR